MEKKLKTKHKILKVTLDLMEKKGLENVSIREIASEAGLTTGAVYHHYASKNEIIIGTFASLDEEYSTIKDSFTESLVADLYDLVVIKLNYFEDMGWQRTQLYLKIILDEINISDPVVSPIYKEKIGNILRHHLKCKEEVIHLNIDLVHDIALSTTFYWALSRGGFDLKSRVKFKLKKLYNN